MIQQKKVLCLFEVEKLHKQKCDKNHNSCDVNIHWGDADEDTSVRVCVCVWADEETGTFLKRRHEINRNATLPSSRVSQFDRCPDVTSLHCVIDWRISTNRCLSGQTQLPELSKCIISSFLLHLKKERSVGARFEVVYVYDKGKNVARAYLLSWCSGKHVTCLVGTRSVQKLSVCKTTRWNHDKKNLD